MTNYNTKTIQVKNTIWTVCFAPQYVAIRKVTNNPFATLGKEFPTLNDAIDSYKSVAMKAALMQLI
jgi:hypothetical protein